jgi:hypothetical protein
MTTTFDLLGDFAITRGFPWAWRLTRLQSRCPRVPVDLSGMTARFEVYDTLHPRRAPWIFSGASGHVTLGGATGDVDIELSAADTESIAATAARYRLIFTDALSDETVFARGRLAILEGFK